VSPANPDNFQQLCVGVRGLTPTYPRFNQNPTPQNSRHLASAGPLQAANFPGVADKRIRSRSEAINRQLSCKLLPTSCSSLLASCHMLPTADCQLPVANCLPPLPMMGISPKWVGYFTIVQVCERPERTSGRDLDAPCYWSMLNPGRISRKNLSMIFSPDRREINAAACLKVGMTGKKILFQYPIKWSITI
jgi:hypothetical protein